MNRLGIRRFTYLLTFSLIVVLGLVGPSVAPAIEGAVLSQDAFNVEVAFPNLQFNSAVDLQNAGDGTNRLFVVEKDGIIRVFNNDRDTSVASVFLDISSVVSAIGTEEGLLGLAFHPDYAVNGYFYVNYIASGPRRTVIERYNVSATNPDQADASSALTILEIPQPYSNHNGGQIAFGSDGYLYIAVGDGGSSGDPQGHGQDKTTLLGSLLRIDVDNPDGGLDYGIPTDNPFYGNLDGFADEIFAFGFRNPWRFSFDPVTDWLWLADVGQSSLEEIDIVESGQNYGWNVKEGELCFNPSSGCNETGLISPIWNYTRTQGISVTGGYVFRGSRNPELVGKYIYGDFGSGLIWSLEYDGINPAINSELADTSINIASFGVDEDGELYIVALAGTIYRFENTATTATTTGTTTTDTTTTTLPFDPTTLLLAGGIAGVVAVVVIIIRRR
ncbi:MAG: PQQ-dependent sugar dehydrogenase [Candidatus Thorarchaeota archaeon]